MLCRRQCSKRVVGYLCVLATVALLLVWPAWLSHPPGEAAESKDFYPPVVFIKTFKTASSTVTGILHHHAVLRNRSCAALQRRPGNLWNFSQLPNDEDSLWPELFDSASIAWNGNRWPKISMWVNHAESAAALWRLVPEVQPPMDPAVRDDLPADSARLQPLAARELVAPSYDLRQSRAPPADVPQGRRFIATIRDPASRFASAVAFKKAQRASLMLQDGRPVPDGHWSDTVRWLRNNSNELPLFYAGDHMMRLNAQCFQLGLLDTRSQRRSHSPTPLRLWNQLEAGQHLLIVTERLDEGLLVLMKDYRLQFEDLVYKSFKVAKTKADVVIPDLQELRDWMYEHHECDLELHRLANRVLDARLQELYAGQPEGQLQRDLRTLQDTRDQALELCEAVSLRVFPDGRDLDSLQRAAEPLPADLQPGSPFAQYWSQSEALVGPKLDADAWRTPINSLEIRLRQLQKLSPERLVDWCHSISLDNVAWNALAVHRTN